MSPSISDLSKRLADSNMYYAITFFVGIVILLVMLLMNGLDLQAMYMNETTTHLLSISGVVMKFLSGFGVMLTYASVCTFVFRRLSDSVKGNRRRLTILKAILILPVLVILVYATYTLANSLLYSQNLSFIENLTALYGMWSLMVLVYIIPVALGRYKPKTGKGTLESVGERISELRYSIWRGYQSYIWRDYGRVYSAEFERYRERMVVIRAILSGFLLWPIAMVLMLFPPLGILSIVMWFRILSLDYKPFSVLERVLLSIIVCAVLFVTTYLFLVSDLASLQTYLDLSYVFGIVFSITLFGIVIWRS